MSTIRQNRLLSARKLLPRINSSFRPSRRKGPSFKMTRRDYTCRDDFEMFARVCNVFRLDSTSRNLLCVYENFSPSLKSVIFNQQEKFKASSFETIPE